MLGERLALAEVEVADRLVVLNNCSQVSLIDSRN